MLLLLLVMAAMVQQQTTQMTQHQVKQQVMPEQRLSMRCVRS
jgi:hypothetical protein